MKVNLLTCLLLFILASSLTCRGSHIRAGELTITRGDCNKTEYTIKLTMYGNTNSPVRPGSGVLSFGDGTNFTIPEGNFMPRADLGVGIGIYVFSINHHYSIRGQIVISYAEPNRNGDILNIQNSISTPFFIESMILIDSQLCNNSPSLLSSPIDKACHQLTFYHNPGVFDLDGDSIAYSLVTPKASSNLQTTYLHPDHSSFYGSDFNTGNESGNGQPQFKIDPLSGTISWDAPGRVGEYNIAFVVEEWRKIDSVFVMIGFVRRDMQILVEECNNKRPEIIVPKDICVFAGTSISQAITGTDTDLDPIKIEAFSGIFSLVNNPANLEPYPPVYQPSASSVLFSWTPSCEAVRNQPYQVTLKITDKPPAGPALVKFEVWNIKVVAPPPLFNQVELDIVDKEISITWSPYTCNNASKIFVWRRVSSNPFTPDDCVSGMPGFAGYTKIAEVLPTLTTFLDDNGGRGLDVGAVYCYRLTALFSSTDGVESQVSIELCAPPILADAPVITHVSVLKTDKTDGKIIVSWQRPFELNNPDYLKPYSYSLLRGDGVTGNTGLKQIQSVAITDTTFTDVGINTKNSAYNYRIILLAKSASSLTLISLDTSAVASSVWNSFTPRVGSIELNWSSETPWSNVALDNPWHLIYRRDENAPNRNLILIDSVNVLESGFTYLDKGQYQNQPLDEYEFYYYQIKTRGTYGNPAIQSPQENLSQVVQATVLDNTPPCVPNITSVPTDCEEFNLTTPCSQKSYANEINWDETENESCKRDIYEYQIFASDLPVGEFTMIGVTRNNRFIEQNLIRRARCYKLVAVDRAGNHSESSDMVCFDNCPSVNFPNVFTPNDDEFNPHFSAYNLEPNCTRFVNQIRLSIFNGWGKKIIDLQDDESMLWNGTDESGKPVATGIYFYQADVSFDVNNPAINYKQIKGWVHVIR